MMPTDEHAERRTSGTGPDAFARLRGQLDELAEYGSTYFGARMDAIVAVLRRVGLWAVVALVAVAILCAMLATATVVGIVGLAMLIGDALGAPWAGYVVTGFGLLAFTMLGLVVGVVWLQRGFRRSTMQKYERRHESQRARFGHDVTGRTAESQRS